MKDRDIYHVSSPAEIVNEILWEIRDMVDSDDKLTEDLNYCIKMVSSGKLYEANIEENADEGDEQRNEAISFFRNIQGKPDHSINDPVSLRKGIEDKINTIDIDERLNLNLDIKKMLSKINTLDFNIFDFKEQTEEKGKLQIIVTIINLYRTLCADFLSSQQA